MFKKLTLAAALLGLTLSGSYAQAGLRISIGIGLPIFAPPPRPVYVAPAPVYVAPAPVYVRPTPPPVYVRPSVYVQPAPYPVPR
jgi:hypothetical protein